jgi:hypothetical protein
MWPSWNRLLAERADRFSVDQPAPVSAANVVTIARNFMCTCARAGRLSSCHALPRVQAALNEYYRVGPTGLCPNMTAPASQVLYNLSTITRLFPGKALILKEPRHELVKYLDVPAFERGDLFYIRTLLLPSRLLKNWNWRKSPLLPMAIKATLSPMCSVLRAAVAPALSQMR